MGLSYTELHEVKFYECDIQQEMTLPMVLSVVVRASESQTYRLMKDKPQLLETLGLGWIITNYTIEVHRFPKQNEKIFVTTKAQEYNKFFCYRDFYIHDVEGQELISIKSVFALMNLEKRKVVPVPDEVVTPYQAEKIKKIHRFPKVPLLDETSAQSEQYRVRYFDLDGNRHVNNAKYVNWMLDTLDFKFLEQHQIQWMNIIFSKEVEYGAIIDSQYELQKQDDKEITLHYIYNEGVLSAQAEIHWTKRKENSDESK